MSLAVKLQCNLLSSAGLVNVSMVRSETITDLMMIEGVNCQAWLSGEIFLQCYAKDSPSEDVMQCICRSAFLVCRVSSKGVHILKLPQS